MTTRPHLPTLSALPAQPAEEPKSRWTVAFDRWKDGAEREESLVQRFKGAFNAFSHASARRVNPWLLAALTAGLIALAALFVYGAIWVYSHPRVYLIYVLFKSAKWIAIGVALIGALVLRNWVMKERPAEGGEPAQK